MQQLEKIQLVSKLESIVKGKKLFVKGTHYTIKAIDVGEDSGNLIIKLCGTRSYYLEQVLRATQYVGDVRFVEPDNFVNMLLLNKHLLKGDKVAYMDLISSNIMKYNPELTYTPAPVLPNIKVNIYSSKTPAKRTKSGDGKTVRWTFAQKEAHRVFKTLTEKDLAWLFKHVIRIDADILPDEEFTFYRTFGKDASAKVRRSQGTWSHSYIMQFDTLAGMPYEVLHMLNANNYNKAVNKENNELKQSAFIEMFLLRYAIAKGKTFGYRK